MYKEVTSSEKKFHVFLLLHEKVLWVLITNIFVDASKEYCAEISFWLEKALCLELCVFGVKLYKIL